MSDNSFIISRKDLAPIFDNPRVLQQFEEIQRAVADHVDTIGANVAATEGLAAASYVTLSPNTDLTNEFVLQVGEGLSLDAEAGVLRLTLQAPVVVGGFSVHMTAQGDSTVVLPLTGVLATREWVNSLGFSTGGAATWGAITGTLSAQSDLSTALAAKLSVTAGTGDWAGFSLSESSGGIYAHGLVTGSYAGIDSSSADSGLVWLQNGAGTNWLNLGGSLTANSRMGISASTGIEFDQTPYVGVNAIYHQGNKPTKSDVGLGNVTNIAQTSVTGLTGTQSVAAFKTGLSLVKGDVGLGSVDNTADAAKAVLSATKLTTARTIGMTGDVTWSSGSFDGSGNVTAAATIGAGKVTLAKIANASASSKLLGSGASGSGASYAELTLGTGLTMTGTTLSASGGGGQHEYEAFNALPLAAAFTGLNVGTDTLTDSATALVLTYPGLASPPLRPWSKGTPPSTPWTIYARVSFLTTSKAGNVHGGIYVRNSTSGKIVTFGPCYISANTVPALASFRYNSFSTFSATNFSNSNGALGLGWADWIAVTNDGTNLKLLTSYDGINFFQIYSETLAAFISSVDDFGIYGGPATGGTASLYVNAFGTAAPS